MTISRKKSSKDKGKLEQPVKTTRAGAQARRKGRSGVVITDGFEVIPTDIGIGSTPTITSPLKNASLVRIKPEPAGKFYGVYPALVTDVEDPDAQGRVKIVLPWIELQGDYIDPKHGGFWARLATLMAGNNRGTWFIPDVDDEVLIAFEGGDPSHPYVIGALWNGQDRPPESMDSDGNNFRKTLKTRNGVKITLDDTDGKESLMLETPAGQKISLTDRNNTVSIEDSNGNSLKFDSQGIIMNVSARVTINASSIEISAGNIGINAGLTGFSGVVKCDTLITNSVVSSSYTPGAGNVW